MSVRPDILALHDNVARRVRNLETGVHPLRATTDWYQSIPPTLFPKDSGGSVAVYTTSTGTARPHYQKRAGIGALLGQLQMASGQHADLQHVNGALWGTLPEPMRPTLDHKFIGWASQPPYIAQIAVLANGQLRAFGGALPDTQIYVGLDGLTWPVA